MKLVTAAHMRAIDRETIEHHRIPGATLMENAGRGIADYILFNIISREDQSIAVFCGKGNNGGDGLVIARHLFEAEIPVTVFFIGPTSAMSEDMRLNYDRALRIGVPMTEVTSPADLPEFLGHDIIIDAIFGTGFDGAPRGIAARMIEYINAQHVEDVEVVAVDLPSGLNGDTGRHEGAVVAADHTCTLQLPKLGLYLSPGRELAGEVAIVEIGIPDDVIEAMDLPLEVTVDEEVQEVLPDRKPDGHKGDFGKLFVVAGSTGLTGAAALTSHAAMRAGTGLVKLGCPAETQPVLAVKLTEVMTVPLPDIRRKGVLALRALGEIRKFIHEHDAVVIGPGLGGHHETRVLVQRLISRLDRPTIIDADGLNAFTGAPDLLEQRSGDAWLVLTPHPGEFRRMTGIEVPEDILERAAVVLDTARRLRCTVVLKGSPTLVADHSGRCHLNPSGNSGMATGGSGDVLSGVIGALLAQGMPGYEAAVAAVFIHGIAGDIAASLYSERGMIAGDIIECLPEAWAMLE